PSYSQTTNSAMRIAVPLEKINDPSVWRVANCSATLHEEGNRKFVHLECSGPGGAWLVGSNFKEGLIEAGFRGRDLPRQKFVGIAFRGVDDKTRDVVYFRPFNFHNPERRNHAVQYESRPNFGWETLRAQMPDKYEAAVDPAPGAEDWFHARIAVASGTVSVFV